jgi:hypothetical protein
MSASHRVHDLGPDARSSRANEAIVASRVRTEVVWQVAPRRSRSQDREDTIEDPRVIHPWHAARLVGQHRLVGSPFRVGEFVAHDSAPSVRGLNHGPAAGLNTALSGSFGRCAPESGPIMLTSSFVVPDPKRACMERRGCPASCLVWTADRKFH